MYPNVEECPEISMIFTSRIITLRWPLYTILNKLCFKKSCKGAITKKTERHVDHGQAEESWKNMEWTMIYGYVFSVFKVKAAEFVNTCLLSTDTLSIYFKF